MATIAEQLKEAQEVQVELRGQIKTLLEKSEKGAWDEVTDGAALKEARTKLDAQNTTVASLSERMELQKRSVEWSASTTTTTPTTVNIIQNRGDSVENVEKEFRLMEAAQQAISRTGLTGIYAEMDQEAKRQMKSSGLPDSGSGNLSIPDFLMWEKNKGEKREKRDITAGTTTTGGYTIQTDLGGLIPFLDPNLTVRQMGATYLPGLTGNVAFPRNDAAATAVWASSENVASTETTPTFDQVTLAPKRITAFTDVSKQNLLQTSIGMENFVRERLNFAVMKLLDYGALQGDGLSGAVTGLFSVSGTNDITIGTDGGALDWSLIVQFETETATDNALMDSLGYLTTPGVAGALKTLKRDVAGNGFIWEGSNTASTVNGYRAMRTTQMPSTLTKGSSGATLHGMIFGNWAELLIGQWGGIDLLVNPYTKGKEALIEFIINAWFDVDVRHAASFCKCDEIDIA